VDEIISGVEVIIGAIPQATVPLIHHDILDPVGGGVIQARAGEGGAVDGPPGFRIGDSDLADRTRFGEVCDDFVEAGLYRLNAARVNVTLVADAVPGTVVIAQFSTRYHLADLQDRVAPEGVDFLAVFRWRVVDRDAVVGDVPLHRTGGVRPLEAETGPQESDQSSRA
jgi:hypothetical protein